MRERELNEDAPIVQIPHLRPCFRASKQNFPAAYVCRVRERVVGKVNESWGVFANESWMGAKHDTRKDGCLWEKSLQSINNSIRADAKECSFVIFQIDCI